MIWTFGLVWDFWNIDLDWLQFYLSDHKSDDFIPSQFETLVGDTSQPNGPISYKYWPSHIYQEHIMNHMKESRCAKYCLLAKPTECNFYYFVTIDQGQNICQLGRFNQDATQDDHYPGIDETTEYKFRKEISNQRLSSFFSK